MTSEPEAVGGSVLGHRVLVDVVGPREIGQILAPAGLPKLGVPLATHHWFPSGCNRSHTALCCPSSAVGWDIWSRAGRGRHVLTRIRCLP